MVFREWFGREWDKVAEFKWEWEYKYEYTGTGMGIEQWEWEYRLCSRTPLPCMYFVESPTTTKLDILYVAKGHGLTQLHILAQE